MSAIIRRVVIAVTFVGDDSMRQARHSHALCPARKILRKEGRQMTKLWLGLVSCCIFVLALTVVGEVSGEAAAINVDDSKLADTVTAAQIANLPLNGRNVYDLIQMAPGAVNVSGVDFENGHNTVVNGLREDFNGFLINGVSNKGL